MKKNKLNHKDFLIFATQLYKIKTKHEKIIYCDLNSYYGAI